METKEPPESSSGPEPSDDEPTPDQILDLTLELDAVLDLESPDLEGESLEAPPDEPFDEGPEEPLDEPVDEPLDLPLDLPLEAIDDGSNEPVEEAPEAPPVVAVVVTTGGPYLDAAVASLAAQDYPALSVLVLDNGGADDPTARIAAEMPTAFVRRLPDNVGFAAAANEALLTVEGATFLVFCHDDVALAPDAVRVLVEEAYRSNAAILGPKLVDYDDPDVLLEVGMTIDHYGVPFSSIEPGEIDQEQHDGVRDVFFVSHATMLVRADLFRELGGFDVATAPGSDDIDLCWRARLVGARVLVAPEARVRHRRATAVDERRMRRQAPQEARAATQARVRVLIKSYSRTALLWVLPSAFALTIGEAVAFALTRRWRHAVAVLTGWLPRRGTDLRQARSSTQRLRNVDDSDVRTLMIRGSARIRGPLVQRLHAGDRIADVSSRARVRMSNTGQRLRRAPAILALVVVLLILVGSRALVFGRVPQIGSFQAWPGIGALWHTFMTPWRTTMLGSQTPATPAFAMMAALTTATIGHAGLARTIVVAGAIPLGMWGSFRLARSLTTSSLPAVVTAVAYVTNPVGRDSIARGDLGPLVSYALAPFLLLLLVRAVEPALHSAAPVSRWRHPLHTVLGLAVLGAIAGAVWPPAILLLALVAVMFVISAVLAGAVRQALRAAALAFGAGLVGFVLLAPWSLSLIGADAQALGLRVGSPMTIGDALRFDVGPAHTGWFTLGLVVAALVPLVFATGPRFVWAARAWILALASFALAWLPTRISPTLPVPAVSGVLVPAALGLALAAGIGVSALLDDMRRAHFGWRQFAAVAAAIGITLPVLALATDTASGRWHLPNDDWPTAVSWMGDLPTAGGFRVLWLGAPALLPVDAKVLGGEALADEGSGDIGFALTRNGPGDARALWAAPETRADDLLERALITARASDSERLGHLLAPAGIRYVVVLSQTGAGHGAVVPVDPALAEAMTRQVDLSISRIDDGGIVYANDAWYPSRAVVPAGTEVAADSGDALAGAASRDIAPVARGVSGEVHESKATGPGTLLWAEAADAGWKASANGKQLARSKAFDWTNAFALTDRAPVGLRFGAGALPGLLIELEIVAWIVALVVWRRTRTRTRRARGRSREVSA
jgi:GT2 family glycosyltransferase